MAVHEVAAAAPEADYEALMQYVCKGIPAAQQAAVLELHAVRTALAIFLPDLCAHPMETRALYSERAIVHTMREIGAQYYTNQLGPLDDLFDPDVKPENYSVVTQKTRTFYKRLDQGLHFKAEIDNGREISIVCVWRKYNVAEAAGPLYRLARLYFSKPDET